MKRFLFILTLILHVTFIHSQNVTGFIYSGTPFEDADWGRSYRTSEQDRNVIRKTDSMMKLVLNKLLKSPGDYTPTISDMRFIFDTDLQRENMEKGSKCATCIYSYSPLQGRHFTYFNELQMELKEDSKTYSRKAALDDSLEMIRQNEYNRKRKDAGSDAREDAIRKEQEAYQKEVEKMELSKLDEKAIAELERKAKAIAAKADSNAKSILTNDNYYHNLFGISYNPVCKIMLETNHPIYAKDKNQLLSLKNNPDYLYKELSLPGCDFACIYFDRYNKSDFLPNSQHPVLLAYSGNIYPNESSLPKQWLQPFCARLTFSGNMEQINEFLSKIDTSRLRMIR